MKKGKRFKVMIAVVVLFLIILVILFPKNTTPFDTNITAVNFCKAGGFGGTANEFTVFEDNGVYYYTDMKDVYTIPKKEFYRFVAKVQKLHLEDINGYKEIWNVRDGYGYSFNIMYNDGTIIAGRTYGVKFPEEYDATLLQTYSEEINTKKICNYEFEINDTYDVFYLACVEDDFINTITVKGEEGEYTVLLDMILDYYTCEVKISKSKYEEIRKMILDVYESLNDDMSSTPNPNITMFSNFYGDIEKRGESNNEEIISLCNRVIDLVTPELEDGGYLQVEDR